MKCPYKINTIEESRYGRHPTSHKVTSSQTKTSQYFGDCDGVDCPFYDSNEAQCGRAIADGAGYGDDL